MLVQNNAHKLNFKLVYLIDSDCCTISELIERVNSPKAILTARGQGMCEPKLRW